LLLFGDGAPPPMKTTFAAAGGFILGMERVTD
jgi:hypothetical protein